MSGKSKRRRSQQVTYNRAAKAALTMFLWAYCSVHDPDPADMANISREIQNVQDGLMSGRLRLKDIEQALKEERGWEIL